MKINTVHNSSKRGDTPILLITPLKIGDKISIETKISVRSLNIPFIWLSGEGKHNPAMNTQIVFSEYSKSVLAVDMPQYVMKVDNDLHFHGNVIENMYSTLEESDFNIAYTYCSFSFTGHINFKFDAIPFSVKRLIRANYISSCSMIKTEMLEKVGGFVTDDKYFRLLDWALWLKFLKYGMVGTPTTKGYFIAKSTKNSVSARSNEDYMQKAALVYEDFIKPITQ